MEDQKMANVYYTFEAAVPVPEKAKALGLERYAHVAWRNFAINVMVTFPEKAKEFGLIQLPKNKSGHSGYMQIVMDESLKDSVTFEVTRADVAKLNLLGVQYFPHSEPGKIIAVLELPPPVAVVKKMINLPRIVHGEYCSNAAISLIVDNMVGTEAPYQDGKSQGYSSHKHPINHRLREIDKGDYKEYCNRLSPDEKVDPEGKVFWPAQCVLAVHYQKIRSIPVRDLIEVNQDTGTITALHPALQEAHPNLLESIADERVKFYLIPETVPRVGWHDPYKMNNFYDLVNAWHNNKLSSRVKAAGRFLTRDEVKNDFYCCMGSKSLEESKNTSLTHACFGQLKSKYKVTKLSGSRVRVRKNGEDELMPAYSGYMVSLPFKTMFYTLAAFYGAFENGEMDLFYEQNLLLFPDELFWGDDHDVVVLYQKQLNEERKAQKNKPDDEGDSKEQDPPAVTFGDNSDKIGEIESDPDEAEGEEPDETEDNDEEDGEENPE